MLIRIDWFKRTFMTVSIPVFVHLITIVNERSTCGVTLGTAYMLALIIFVKPSSFFLSLDDRKREEELFHSK